MPSLFRIMRLGLLFLLSLIAEAAKAAVCKVPGGTADDSPAIKAALATCNNGGTVRLAIWNEHVIGHLISLGSFGQDIHNWHRIADHGFEQCRYTTVRNHYLKSWYGS